MSILLAARLLLGGWLKSALAFLKRLPWWVFALIAALVLLAIVYRHGETKGAAKVEHKAEQQHTARVAEARTDERAAQDVTAAIGASVARSDDKTTELVRSTIEDMHHAIDAIPPAPAGAPLPPAPVDGVRDKLNALIDGAERAAKVADAEP